MALDIGFIISVADWRFRRDLGLIVGQVPP